MHASMSYNSRTRITPPAGVDVSMVAPKAPGHRVRELFKEGVGVPALVAVHQDASGRAKAVALAYARALGCSRPLAIATAASDGLNEIIRSISPS